MLLWTMRASCKICWSAQGKMQHKCTEELLLLLNEIFCITFYQNKKTFTQTRIILFCSGLWDYLNHWCNNWFNAEHPSFWQWKAFEKHLQSLQQLTVDEQMETNSKLSYEPQKPQLFFFSFWIPHRSTSSLHNKYCVSFCLSGSFWPLIETETCWLTPIRSRGAPEPRFIDYLSQRWANTPNSVIWCHKLEIEGTTDTYSFNVTLYVQNGSLMFFNRCDNSFEVKILSGTDWKLFFQISKDRNVKNKCIFFTTLTERSNMILMLLLNCVMSV